ncbi:MAG: ATP-dependent Clp protease proteolytic subunit [Planctomycetes bacterium]|nr:ATP-dependent Clp protease proteolytic subunit [Planctomycetota bacterium]
MDFKRLAKKNEEDAKKDSDEGVLLRMLKTRTIVLADEFDKDLSRKVITQLLLLEADDPGEKIRIIINSPGGDADAGFAIYDIINFIKPPVQTICAGLTASAAVIVLLAGTRGQRYALPNARLLIHQPSTSVRGAAADIEIEASEILKFRTKINKLIADETGQKLEKVEADTRRNYWMSAEEALKYGLINKVIKGADQI